MPDHYSELVTTSVGRSGSAYNEMEILAYVRGHFGSMPLEWE